MTLNLWPKLQVVAASKAVSSHLKVEQERTKDEESLLLKAERRRFLRD